MSIQKNILILDPFLKGSHKKFWDCYQRYSRHHVTVQEFDGTHWKLSSGLSGFTKVESSSGIQKMDVFLCSDFFDLTSFVGLNPSLAHVKKICYFHENQFEYPVRKQEQRDAQFSLINLRNYLASDYCVFNSRWNFDSFRDGVKEFRRRVPAVYRNLLTHDLDKPHSTVFPGHDLAPVDQKELERSLRQRIELERPLRVIWPHRWEHDKGIERLKIVVECLVSEGLIFDLDLCGEKGPDAEFMKQIKEIAGERVVNFGYYSNTFDYHNALINADVVLSTTNHEFFGISVLEALSYGCYPLLPNGYAYPELYAPFFERSAFYQSDEELITTLTQLCRHPNVIRQRVVDHASYLAIEAKYRVKPQCSLLDDIVERL